MPDTVGNAEQVAWELHVELATRVSAVPLREGEGLLREAVASLEQLAEQSRQILGGNEPHPDPSTVNSRVESIAREMLADVVEPFVLRWKPRIAAVRDEGDWDAAATFRQDLAAVRARLRPLAERLAELAGASSLLLAEDPESG